MGRGLVGARRDASGARPSRDERRITAGAPARSICAARSTSSWPSGRCALRRSGRSSRPIAPRWTMLPARRRAPRRRVRSSSTFRIGGGVLPAIFVPGGRTRPGAVHHPLQRLRLGEGVQLPADGGRSTPGAASRASSAISRERRRAPAPRDHRRGRVRARGLAPASTHLAARADVDAERIGIMAASLGATTRRAPRRSRSAWRAASPGARSGTPARCCSDASWKATATPAPCPDVEDQMRWVTGADSMDAAVAFMRRPHAEGRRPSDHLLAADRPRRAGPADSGRSRPEDLRRRVQ